MNERTSRRSFLRTAAVAGGLLAGVPRLRAADSTSPSPANAGVIVPGESRTSSKSPIAVVVQSVSRDVNPRAAAWMYIHEILQRAGLFFDQLSVADLPSIAHGPCRVLLLAGDLRLTTSEQQAVKEWVNNGGTLLGIGGTSRLNEVFGVSSVSPVAEGWVKITNSEHPLTAGLRSSLHVFGGCAVKSGAATSLAQLEVGAQAAKGSALLENRFGKGRALLLAPDLIFSIVHIQQGLPVLQDVRSAPDESAATAEGVLKAEDGMVLDWSRDRQPMQPDGGMTFLEPVSDELRELILRGIFYLAREQQLTLPLLWYWPRALKAVAHLSHDTDGHDPQKGKAMFELVKEVQVKSTWCTLYPGGYPRDMYPQLVEQGYEVALHYDAMTGEALTSWSKENFLFQHAWLLQEAQLKHISSNKNHYTRWENRLDFYRWCEEVGINSDQTRGPSKKGTIGFPLGGSQPYFPLDDEGDSPRMLKVLEVNMMTQDLVVVCPAEYGNQLVDSAMRHHGVAHFLFHPAHVLKPATAQALRSTVDYARMQGLEWWTNEQIYRWEVLRRSVAATFDARDGLTLQAATKVPDATLLFLKPKAEPRPLQVGGQPISPKSFRLYGFDFDAVTLDLAGNVRVQVG